MEQEKLYLRTGEHDESHLKISLTAEQKKFSEIQDRKKYPFYCIPMIGKYGEGYPRTETLASFLIPRIALPPSIQKAIEHYSNVVCTVRFELGFGASPYNIVYHECLKKWTGQKEPHISIPMGIFDPQGIAPQDIATNNLRNIDVYCHDGCYSPNNAHFSFNAQKLASFWTVGAYGQNAVVCLHIFFDNIQNDEPKGLDNTSLSFVDFLVLFNRIKLSQTQEQKIIQDTTRYLLSIALPGHEQTIKNLSEQRYQDIMQSSATLQKFCDDLADQKKLVLKFNHDLKTLAHRIS